MLGVSFWIASDTGCDEAGKIERQIKQKVMTSGLNITDCRVVTVRGLSHIQVLHL